MISWFKKYFIPHEDNEHRPHILRNYSIRVILVLIIFFEIFTFFIPTLNYISRLESENLALVLPSVLSLLANDERQTQKLPILTVNSLLTEAAELKAKDMADFGYFAHTSPEGKTPWYWIEQVGYQYQYAGENLAINFSDSEDVVKAWMESASHRANITKDKYTEIGTGVATGVYKGRETVFVAQVYANPNKVVILPVSERKAMQSPPVAQNLPTVLGAEKLSNVLGEEIIVDDTLSGDNQSTEVKAESVDFLPEPTFMQKLFASPRNTTNGILFVVFGLVAVALILNTFIKIKHHHPDLIINGLVLLLIICTIFVLNNYFSKHNMVVLDGIDYSIEK